MHRRQSKLLTIEPYMAGMCTAKFPYNAQVNEWLKRIPGVRWGGRIKPGAWLIPEELYAPLVQRGREFGWKPVLRGLPRKVPEFKHDDLYAFQKPVVAKLLQQESLLCLLDTGLGKTVCTIAALRAREPMRVLVVSPAMVRRHWRDELLHWWPRTSVESDPGRWQIHLVEAGKHVAAIDTLNSRQVVIVSPELAKHVAKMHWDAVVFDEMHYYKDARTARSKTIQKISWRNHHGMRIGLTATPISINPKDSHNQLHILWAYRFAGFFDFAKWYIEIDSDTHTDWLFGGLQEEHVEELNQRLDYVTIRKTKNDPDVAPHLPDNIIQPLRIPAPAQINLRELLEDFARPDQHTARARESMLRATGSTKIRHAVQFALEELEVGNSHVAVAAYYHDTAREIARALEEKGPKDVPVIYVDGTIPTGRRHEKLEEAKKHKLAFLVCTLESVNVGIDLTFHEVAICAELYPSLKTMSQFFGRFGRLSGKVPSKIILMILEGTQDEAIANVLIRRARETNKIVRPGQAEAALESLEGSEEDFLEDIAAAAGSMLEGDEYV